MKIIGISGRKQSGKNTVANFMSGRVLKENLLVEDFSIDDKGQLLIKTEDLYGKSGWGILDVTRKDEEYVSYAEPNIWPLVKVYHFADYLKSICVDLFDLTHEQVYGTDDQKNTDTPYGMTARDFLQYFGTDIMRNIKDTVWVDYTISKILQDNSKLSLIPDVRFPNEVDAIHKAGGIVIRLTRDVKKSDHACESALDFHNFNWDDFDVVINNNDCSVQSLCDQISEMSPVWRI
jgi:hypothetical protein